MAAKGRSLVEELAFQLRGGNAHAKLEDVTRDLAIKHQGARPNGVPYSPWQLLEHIRIAQNDMLRFSRNSDGSYVEMKWPEAYWPSAPEPPDKDSWERSVQQIVEDREAFIELISDPKADLLAKFPWGEHQTLLHEAMLIIDHNAYHLGEIVAIRRMLGAWH